MTPQDFKDARYELGFERLTDFGKFLGFSPIKNYAYIAVHRYETGRAAIPWRVQTHIYKALGRLRV